MYKNQTKALFQKVVSGLMLMCFFSTSSIPVSHAQEIFLPAPGTMVDLSPSFSPPMLKGIKVYLDNPFLFDFILDNGDNKTAGQEDASKLVKYFLASLTTPEKEMWVNLSPYEKDRIVPESFGQTEMGRDLLAQDYMLKQITASLMYPEDEVGKKFWERIRTEAQKKFGTSDIPMNTFNKVWIVPEKAVVYENPQSATAYIIESSLKVMLEEDYVALSNQKDSAKSLLAGTGLAPAGDVAQNNKDTNALGSQIVREIVIPELTKEVNFGKNFSQLRQIYNSLILAAWYKKKIKDSILSQVYVDQNKVAGVNIDDPQEKQKIYDQYLEAFKKGAYNYIKEEVDPVSQELIPKKYFSGGISALKVSNSLEVTTDRSSVRASAPVQNGEIMQVQVASTAVRKLPSIEENDVSFSSLGFDEMIINGRNIWPEFKNRIGEAKQWSDEVKEIEINGIKFLLIKKRIANSGEVFTLSKDKFEQMIQLMGWRKKSEVLSANDDDVVFSMNGFFAVLIGGQAIWKEFYGDVGDIDSVEGTTKPIIVNGRTFNLIKKRSGVKTVFTLSRKEFSSLAALKKWREKVDLPSLADDDVAFSVPGFGAVLNNGYILWPDFKREFNLGEAKDWEGEQRPIIVGDRTFTLLKKINFSTIVFALPRKEFMELAKLRGWKEKIELPPVENDDIVLGQVSFNAYIFGGQKFWRKYKAEVLGEAADWPEPTKEVVLGEVKFQLTRKKSGKSAVFTIPKSQFKSFIRLNGWKEKIVLPPVSDDDAVLSSNGLAEFLNNAPLAWRDLKAEIGEAEDWLSETRELTVEGTTFVLTKKLLSNHQVFTLPRAQMDEFIRLKGMRDRDYSPIMTSDDVAFSPSGFSEFIWGGAAVWAKFRTEVGDANTWAEPTKTIEAGGINYVLVKKRFGTQLVFTLPRAQFKEFLTHQNWDIRTELLSVKDNEVVLSYVGLKHLVVNFERSSKLLKEEIGEAKDWPAPTRQIELSGRMFTLLKRKRLNGNTIFVMDRPDFLEFAKLKGWEIREDIEDLIVREGLEKVISDLGRDPKMLLSYLFLTTTLDPDMIHRIVRRSVEGLRGINEEEINFGTFKSEEGTVELSPLPDETDQPSILLEGKVTGDFTAIQLEGDRNRVIWVREDGTFRARIILAAGEDLNLRLFPFNEENKTFGDSQVIHVQQTSEPKNIEAMIADLLKTKADLIERIAKDKTRLAYLRKRLEVGLLNHFTEDEAVGFAYLDEQIAGLPADSLTRILYEGIKTRFEEIASIDQKDAEGFHIDGLNSNQRLFFYQKYAIYESMQAIKDYEESKDKPVDPDRPVHMPAKVIALEQGLGKTVIALAVARSNSDDGALVVAPNSVVSAWGEQEGHFFTEQRAVAIKGSSKEKTQQLTAAEEGSLRVVNIEYLRSTEPDRLAALNKDPNQIAILDESQAFSREGSLQSQIAGQIQSKYTLLISATPFSSTQTARALLRFITKQAGYEDSKVFSQYFLNDPDALRLLHFLVDQYVIRIKKTDVFKTYDPAVPLAQQNNRLPRKTFVEPEQIGAYEMSAEQAESILDLFFRWDDWQARKKTLVGEKKATNTQDDKERGKSEGEMYFSKMHALRQLMNDPRYVGIDAPSAKHAKMDEIVDKEVVQGKGKVVIFASYKEQVKTYMERYAQHGAVSYYGDTLNDQTNSRGNLVDKATGAELKFRKINKFEYAIDEQGHLIPDANGDAITPLDYNRYRFQFDPEVKVIIATFDAGAVGVTFTAADAVIFDDLARDYTVMYQAEDRANRIDNLRKKYENRYYRLEARYPQAFIESLRGKYAIYTADGPEIVSEGDAKLDEAQKKEQKVMDLYQIFSRGTYDEIQGHNIMVNQKRIFDLVLDGIESEEDLLKQGEDSLKNLMPMFFTNGSSGSSESGDEAGSSPIKAGDTQTKGGIDFNADNLNLQTQSNGGEIKFEMNPAQFQELQNAPGFTPTIINIQPMINLQIFLGLSDKQESAPLAKM